MLCQSKAMLPNNVVGFSTLTCLAGNLQGGGVRQRLKKGGKEGLVKKFLKIPKIPQLLTIFSSVRPKGFFSFRPKLKLAEIAIFLFGRNRYRKKVSVSAETEITFQKYAQ